MALFGKGSETVAVLDIRSSSIGAGFVVCPKDGAPTLAYVTRTPIDPHATEPIAEAFPRTLERTLHTLVTEGAPVLRKIAGNAKTDRVLVTITAPWQYSVVYSKTIEKEKPFIFSKEVLHETEKEAPKGVEGYTQVSEMIIATLLNGYEVQNPFGKKASRAELIMLSSSVEDATREIVEKAVRKSLHQHHISWNAFMPEAYLVFRNLYPHQRDFLIMDVGNEATDVLLVKHGLLISATCMPHGVGEITRAARGGGVSSASVPTLRPEGPAVDMSRGGNFAEHMDATETAWLTEMSSSLGSLAKQEPLPRTVFLMAEDNVRDFLKHLVDAPQLRSLWLSDEALSILPILPGQFATFLAEGSASPGDSALAILALAAKSHP
jgi:hypothetical protein